MTASRSGFHSHDEGLSKSVDTFGCGGCDALKQQERLTRGVSHASAIGAIRQRFPDFRRFEWSAHCSLPENIALLWVRCSDWLARETFS
jgi:hypothetical protein